MQFHFFLAEHFAQSVKPRNRLTDQSYYVYLSRRSRDLKAPKLGNVRSGWFRRLVITTENPDV